MKGIPLKYRLSDFLKGEDNVSRRKSVLILGTVIGATTLGRNFISSDKPVDAYHNSSHVSTDHVSAVIPHYSVPG